MFPKPLTEKESNDIKDAVNKAKQADINIAVLG